MAHLSAWEGNYADTEAYATYVLDNYEAIGITGSLQNILEVDNIVDTKGLFNASYTTYAPYRLVAFNFLDNKDVTQSGHLEQWTLCEPYIRKIYPDLYVTKDSLYHIYDDWKDLRFGIDTVAGSKYRSAYIDMTYAKPIFKKINVVQNGAGKDGDFAVFGSSILLSRMEDMLLLRAEALAVLNRVDDAVEQLNQLRVKRGLSQVSFKKNFGEDVNKLIDNIFAERRRELIGEGHRWYDLIRRQRILQDDPDFLVRMENGGIYWPVSEEVIRQNNLIRQNEYWNN